LLNLPQVTSKSHIVTMFVTLDFFYHCTTNTVCRYLLVFTNVCTFIVIKILHKQSLM